MRIQNIFYILLIFTTSSCYNITHRLHKEPRFTCPGIDNTCEIYELNKGNFFVLKIKRTSSNKIISSAKDTIYADIRYHIFDQVTSMDSPEFISEETYLYLADPIDTTKTRGRAVYFTTYVLLNDSYKEVFLNDPYIIHSGIIREVKVGYWIAEGNSVSIYFNQKDKSLKKNEKLIGFKGMFEQNTDGEKILIIEKASTVATAKEFVYNQEPTISNIDKNLLYFDIKNVFSLNTETGLYFLPIPKYRKFSVSRFTKKKQRQPDSEYPYNIIDKIVLPHVSGYEPIEVFFKDSNNGIYYRYGGSKKKKKRYKKKNTKCFSLLNGFWRYRKL